MKCETVQAMMARYLREGLSAKQTAKVSEHLTECVACREELAFHRSIESRMDGSIEAPEELRALALGKVAHRPVRRELPAQILGDPLMKKILISSTAVTAALGAVLLFAPASAHASTPIATFNAMRSALASAVRSGELTLTASISKPGTVSVSGTLDGTPLPPDIPLLVNVKRDGNVYDIVVTANLETSNYSAIKFGKDRTTLELTPKGAPGHRVEVSLDPESLKPKSWTSMSLKDGAWTPTGRFNYNLKESAKPAPNASGLITAHIRMIVGSGGSGSLSIKDGAGR